MDAPIRFKLGNRDLARACRPYQQRARWSRAARIRFIGAPPLLRPLLGWPSVAHRENIPSRHEGRLRQRKGGNSGVRSRWIDVIRQIRDRELNLACLAARMVLMLPRRVTDDAQSADLIAVARRNEVAI